MSLYLSALDTGLMPVVGNRNAFAALQKADALLSKEATPGTIVFITDGFDTQQVPQFKDFTARSQNQVLVLTVGTVEGGPLRAANGEIQTDASGRPLRAQLEEAHLRQLASEADIPIASKYEAALKAYDNALLERRDFPQAIANRALVAGLIPKPDDSEAEQAPDLKPDELKFDNQKDKGKEVKIDAAMLRKQSADLWMRNLQVSPADFLRQKFRIEADEAGAASHD